MGRFWQVITLNVSIEKFGQRWRALKPQELTRYDSVSIRSSIIIIIIIIILTHSSVQLGVGRGVEGVRLAGRLEPAVPGPQE
jgi:hypothetical protein